MMREDPECREVAVVKNAELITARVACFRPVKDHDREE